MLFSEDSSTSIGFWPYLLAGGLGTLAGVLWSNWSWGDLLLESARRGDSLYWGDQLLYVPYRTNQ